MSPHARRVLNAARAAWRRIRHGPPCPGLPDDGGPLDALEMAALITIMRGLRQPAATERSRP